MAAVLVTGVTVTQQLPFLP